MAFRSSNKIVSQKDHDDFIKQLNREQAANGIDDDLDLILSDSRRLVFVSVFGLFRTYKQTPMILLYSSLFVLPIKKKWIYNPLKFGDEFKDSIIGLQEPRELQKFLQLIRWKDSQGLLCCMLDDYDSYSNCKQQPSSSQDMIASFWRFFSDRLLSLKLNALDFDAVDIWNVGKPPSSTFQSEYNTTYLAVLTELVCHTMRYAAMQHIILESNPTALKPIVSYSPLTNSSSAKSAAPQFVPSKMDGKDDSIWYISTDYETD